MTTKVTPDLTTGHFRKNAIINGDFNVWQRGTSFATIASGAYHADRWKYAETGDSVHTVSRSTDVPTVAQAGRLFNYSLLVDCTTVDAAIAAGDFAGVQQTIEGYNWLPLAQRACTLSFWVKATKIGTYCVAFRNNSTGTPDRSYVAEYTINTTETWEKKTISLAASPSAGTWDYTNGAGLDVFFLLAAGSTFHTTAGAWQTGNFFATSNQVNGVDSTNNNFRITGVQLEAGSVATEFEQRMFQDELALCQRYYEKSYDYAVAIGTVINTGAPLWTDPVAAGAFSIQFKVSKRATPTVTTYSPVSGASGQYGDLTSSASFVATPSSQSENGFNWTASTHGAADEAVNIHFTASAEL